MHLTPLGIRVPDNTDSTELWTHFDNMADDIDALIAARQLASLETWVRKNANESINNSAVMQNDDALLFAAAANSIYVVEGLLLVTISGGASAADFKLGFSGPAGFSWSGGGPGPDVAMAGGQAIGSTNWAGVIGAVGTTLTYGLFSTGVTVIPYQIVVSTVATAGNVNLQWAMNAATAVNLTVNAGSYLHARKVA